MPLINNIAANVIFFFAATVICKNAAAAETESLLHNAKVIQTQYPKPDFGAMTATKASFGVLSAAAMVAAGNDIVKSNHVKDPAINISHDLAKILKAKRHIKLLGNKNTFASKDDIPGLIATYPHADYLLDVKTYNWMFGYYPTDWTHFRVIYGARLRVIDVRNEKIVTEKICQSTQGDEKNPPTKDQLLENKAALLKLYIEKGAKQCTEIFLNELLVL